MQPRRRLALLGCATALNVFIAGAAISGGSSDHNRVLGQLLYMAIAFVSVLAVIGTLTGWRGAAVLRTVSMIWAGLMVLAFVTWIIFALAGRPILAVLWSVPL